MRTALAQSPSLRRRCRMRRLPGAMPNAVASHGRLFSSTAMLV